MILVEHCARLIIDTTPFGFRTGLIIWALHFWHYGYEWVSMSVQYWNSVLRLMSIMVLADNKVYPEKLSCFAANCLKLRDDIDRNTIMTSKMAVEWFINNRADVRLNLMSSQSKQYIGEAIRALRDFPHKEKLLIILQDLAAADGPEHISEKRILEQVVYRWEQQDA